MSVIRSQRGESALEFLKNAKELEAFTIRKCVNTIPKRYTFYIGQHLASLATDIYDLVKDANSRYPTNGHEVQTRRDLFLSAYSKCQCLISQIELAYDIIRFDADVIQEWTRLVDAEMRLIKGVLKSDEEKFKRFSIIRFDVDILQKWMHLVDEEIRLIKGAIKSGRVEV